MIDKLALLHPVADARAWRIDLTTPLPGGADWLSREEQGRAARLARPVDERRYVAAHAALRLLLGEALRAAPETLEFAAGPFGKPRLATQPACRFSLSHSDDVAVVALASDRAVGVDVECLREVPDAIELAEAHFAPSEVDALRHAEGVERAAAFLTVWTRKEACLKAIGHGLSIDPALVVVGAVADRRIVRVVVGERVVEIDVQSLPAGAGVVAALAHAGAADEAGAPGWRT